MGWLVSFVDDWMSGIEFSRHILCMNEHDSTAVFDG